MKIESPSLRLFALGIFVVAAAWLISGIVSDNGNLWISQAKDSRPPLDSRDAPPGGNAAARNHASVATKPTTLQDFGSDRENLAREFRRLLGDLRSELSRGEALKRLAALQSLVHEMSPDLAAEVIIEELRSGENAPTDLDFVVGPEGVMSEVPTYRTALLDLLGQTDPDQSADYARELMSETGEPDEYSLALRNLAWASSGGEFDAELQERLAAMLDRQDWRQSPSKGYLQAFDVAVATASIGQMTRLLETPPDAGHPSEEKIGRAAFVALDRIMLGDPGKVVDAFRQDPSLLAEAPVHRASIMSRLDVRQPDQLALLQAYLQRDDHGDGELAYFADIFPNGNHFAGYRMVTPWQRGPSMSEVEELDRATLATTAAWLSDPKFASAKETLSSVFGRLQEFSRPVDDAGE